LEEKEKPSPVYKARALKVGKEGKVKHVDVVKTTA
jgi:hypothetical protein